MADERFNVELTACHHVEDGFKVTLFCPANIGKRIVLPFVFVVGVIATRAVGAGDLEAEFFFIEVGTTEFQTRDTDQNDTPAFAGHTRCLGDRIIGFGGRGDNDSINTFTTTERHTRCDGVFAIAGVANVCTELFGEIEFS